MEDSSPCGPFTPGTTIDSPPVGEVERQAVASLRGYAYQVAATALAWLDLDDRSELYLEVAEDYAKLAEQSLAAVQVKDTAKSGSVTLNTKAIRDAVRAFVVIVTSNEGRDVQLRYLTTSPVGIEQKTSDRPAGVAGLLYWRQAAASADVGPLRAILTSDKFSTEVHAFVKARDDESLRRDLLQRIHWDCGMPDLAGLMQEIEEHLVVLGRDRFNLPATEARRLGNVLIYNVLKKSVLKIALDRVLSRAELYIAIDAATSVSVPRRTASSMLDIGAAIANALASGQSLDATFSAVDTDWLIPSGDLATPRGVISRQAVASRIELELAKHRCVLLVGGSGLGKSLVAREVAGKRPVGFVTVDLRDVDAGEAAQRLGLTLGRIGTLTFDCLIFDDFNQMEDGRARTAFVRCVQSLQRRDRLAIVTAYRCPSRKAMTELGLAAPAVIEIPYLTEEEANEIVRTAGGNSELWGQIAFAAGAQGHPQLVHAFVMGVPARGWSRSEVRDVVIRGFASDDIDAERDAARRSMVAALSEDSRNLLYRLSLVFGRFDRELALTLAELPPPIQRAGELIDDLIGSWVEVLGKNALRVSPLAANAGQGMLTGEAQRAIHSSIAIQMLAKRRIDANEANGILTHGLLGKEVNSLFRLSYSVLTAESKATELLREHFFMLQMLRTDQPIFADDRPVSIMLRLAQLKLVSGGEGAKQTASCADALMREIGEEPDATARALFEWIALVSILNTIGIASSVPNWVELLERLRIAGANPVLNEFKNAAETASREEGRTFYGGIFSVGISHLHSVERLEEILVDLDDLSSEHRLLWLETFESHPADYSLLVNPPWVAEALRDELNAADAAERYSRMALLTQKWGVHALAVQCYTARAVMFDEYLNDETGALAALDQAITTIGSDVAFSRSRAKIFWRHDKHQEAVNILRAIADVVGRDSPVDRAFAMREAANSAAKTDDWAQAVAWFGEAQEAAAASGTDDMQTMAVGLEADRAVALMQIGDVEPALRAMESCLTRLAGINFDASLRAAYCHRVVRHCVLWMEAEIDRRQTLLDGETVEMLPGVSSNPDPPNSISQSPLAPLDLTWYMLAGAETSSGRDIGIAKSRRSKLKDGPILFMEATLRQRQITVDAANSDSAGFARHLLDYLAGMEYLRREHQTRRDPFNPMALPRGEIQPLAFEDLAQPLVEGLAVDAVIAFGSAAALRGRADPTVELQRHLTSAISQNYPGKCIVDEWRGVHATLAPLDDVVTKAVALMWSGKHLDPRTVWGIGLRLFEKLRQSHFRNLLAPLLAAWLREQWTRIIANETFRLSRPMQTIPAIEASLAGGLKSEPFVATLLLTSAEGVGSPLSVEYEKNLKEISGNS
jgi:ATPase family associated with various cellular activities (AAA)